MTLRLWLSMLSWAVLLGLGACVSLPMNPYELGVHPEHLRARFNLAVIYHDQHKYSAAREQYYRLLDYYPNHARSLVNLADIAQAEGDLEQAQRLLLRAVAAEPDRAYPYSFLGRFLQQQGQLDA